MLDSALASVSVIATDPLSLVLIACIVFPGAFLVLSTLLGMGHGAHTGAAHGLHLGGGHGHVIHGAYRTSGHAQTAAGHAPPAGHTVLPTPGTHAPAPGTRVAFDHLHGVSVATPPSMGALERLSDVALTVNLNAVLIFLFGFGLVGYLLHNLTDMGGFLVLLAASAAGVIAAAALNIALAQLFGEESGRLENDSSEMVGRIARVTLPIHAGGIGEVVFPGDNGTRRSLGARAADRETIERDADVVIIAYADGIAVVQSWDSFLMAASATSTTVGTPP